MEMLYWVIKYKSVIVSIRENLQEMMTEVGAFVFSVHYKYDLTMVTPQ